MRKRGREEKGRREGSSQLHDRSLYRTRQTLQIHNSSCLQLIQSGPALLALPSVLGGLGVHHFHWTLGDQGRPEFMQSKKNQWIISDKQFKPALNSQAFPVVLEIHQSHQDHGHQEGLDDPTATLGCKYIHVVNTANTTAPRAKYLMLSCNVQLVQLTSGPGSPTEPGVPALPSAPCRPYRNIPYIRK